MSQLTRSSADIFDSSFCLQVMNLLRRAACLLGFAVLLGAPLGAHAQQQGTPNRAAVTENYGKLPLSFEANQGQSDPRVKFLSRGSGYSLFLTDSSAVLALTKRDASRVTHAGAKASAPKPASASQARKTDVVHMKLAGTNPDAHIAGTDQLPGNANYFIGNDPAKWHSNVPTYSKVQYIGVYPGVDLVYYGNQRQLEYDFVVAPGADPKPIRLEFAGVNKLTLTADGDLKVSARNGEIAFHKPVIYQEEDGRRRQVEGQFSLLANRAVGFTLGQYDHAKPLVIDPVLAYSTYLGGSGGDVAGAIAVDSSGDSYVTGQANSTDFPITSGAFQTVDYAGLSSAFVTKLNSTGTALLYSTYLGYDAFGYGIAVDGSGDAYVTGSTSADSYPVTAGAFQTKNNNSATNQTNAFITRLNSTGSALLYSTYLGGSGDQYVGDWGTAIAVDSSGDAYVTGLAVSDNFPVTAGAFQTVNKSSSNGQANAFVAKFNSTGTALVYSTYLGGSATDEGNGIAVDGSGDAYVTGLATSTNFPVTAGAFQVAVNGSQGNAFVSKLNPAGTQLVYSTYLGGSGASGLYFDGLSVTDAGAAIAVDGSGYAYVTGFSTSAHFPVTTGAFQVLNNSAGGSNAFVTKVNLDGTALVYSTYLGGSSPLVANEYGNNAGDLSNGIAVDASGDAYITGQAYSTNFPVTPGAFQTANKAGAGFTNAFVVKLNPTGSALLYSTYLGGAGRTVDSVSYGDVGNGIAVDGSGGAYVTGQAGSASFPITTGAYQQANQANGSTPDTNAFVAKLDLNAGTPPTVTVTPSSSSITTAEALTVTVYVGGPSGYPIPTGSVTLTGGGYTSEATALTSGSTTIDVPAGSLATGTDPLTATYTPDSSSSSVYDSSTGTYSVTVTTPAKTTPTVAVTPSASSITTAQALTVTVAVNGGTGNPTPTGSVTLASGSYSAQQALATGSATFSLAAGALPAGSDTLAATYTPGASSANMYTTATKSATVTVTTPIGTSTSTMTVTPSATNITNQQTVKVTVSVTGGSGQATPTGTITVASGAYSGQQTLANGVVSFSIPAGTLSSGANTLSASYSGDGTYATASGTTAVTVSQVVITAPAPAAVSPGASATATVTLTAGSTFSGTMNLTCSLTGSPTGAQSLPTCSIKPAGVTLASGGSGSTVLTVDTTATSTTSLVQPFGKNLWGLGGGGAALACLLMLGIPSRRRRWVSMLVLLAVVVAIGAIGCSNPSPAIPSTPPTTAGSYAFTVTATSGTVTASTTIPLSVQ